MQANLLKNKLFKLQRPFAIFIIFISHALLDLFLLELAISVQASNQGSELLATSRDRHALCNAAIHLGMVFIYKKLACYGVSSLHPRETSNLQNFTPRNSVESLHARVEV